MLEDLAGLSLSSSAQRYFETLCRAHNPKVILVLAGLREAVMKAVPDSLKLAIAVGIGLFILFIGFVNGGLITSAVGTPVQFVFPNTATAALTLLGLLVAVILHVLNVRGALVLTILITAVLALILVSPFLESMNPQGHLP